MRTVAPADVLPGEPKNEPPPDGADPRATDATRLSTSLPLPNAAAAGLVGDDPQDVIDVVTEFASDAEQVGSILRTEDDAVPVELATEHFNLSKEDADPGVATGLEALEEEVHQCGEPTLHDDLTPTSSIRKCSNDK